MKKMMTIAAALFVAVAANAATLNWGSVWVYSTAPDGTVPGGGANALYNEGTLAGTAWLVLLAGNNASGISVGMGGSVNVGVGNTLADTKNMTGTFGAPSATVGSESFVSGQWYAMAVYDSANNMYGVSTTQQLTVNTISNSGDMSFENAAGLGNAGEIALNFRPVPEPTSLALLGLGAAALALRRRIRKA